MTSHTAVCDTLRDRALIERYVAGRLSEDEAAELETHYLTCARCQADVRLAAAIAAAPVVAAPRSRMRWKGPGVAIAAGLAALLLLSQRRHANELRPLGAVDRAPAYLGIAVRGNGTTTDSILEAAMNDYGAHRYDAAIAGLDAVLRAGADSAPAEFFRAAGLLMMGRNDDAAGGFRRVVALGPTPYLPESHYYLAKALIRMGRTGDAVAELRKVGLDHREIYSAAAALADSVEAVMR